MNILVFIGQHWPWAVAVVIFLALCAFVPGFGAIALRWLLGTEVGRYVLVAAVVIVAGVWAWDARFSAGHAAAVAEQAAAADRAQVAAAIRALDAYMAGAQASADIGLEREKGHAAALAARDRTIACLRDGSCRLREHWTCPALPAGTTAAAGAGSDEAADLRRAGSGDLVRVGDTADADLIACQAQVMLYQQIGVLRADVDDQHASRPGN